MTAHPDSTRGVLDLSRGLESFRLERMPPGPVLSAWVENYWEVAWDLPPGAVHRQTNLSHAAMNIAVEPDGAWLYGVPGPTFVREIQGQGRVFGIKFHPGAFYPWWGQPLKPLFDRRLPLHEVWGPDGMLWSEAVAAEPTLAGRAALTNQFLGERLPDLPGEGRRCAKVLVETRSLLKVEGACNALGYEVRSLQRLFAREVGVGPKEVLRRYRLMEAADRLVREPEVPGADLAASLGYVDQAHFVRDFKAVTGVPPEAYRRRQNR